ncbi:aminotransferase class IV [Homoserinibacter sp. YIM 151385]|uniref:aminotransferase class IV n=1 Tax=Homoserinibacter sp. YIM 151385 TaxID=2985506 RepID=UPI0022F000FB|nr:aminotransferase class IV [Homoserinibacter sp. YIM 151385]WBU38950.1 aminotransferase class IV [Homoserinibacter sp. YIM 151385]
MSGVVSTWRAGRLEPREGCDLHPARIAVADSWLVDDGRALAIDLHRERFLGALPPAFESLDPAGFWDAALRSIGREGARFPRVEARWAAASARAAPGEWRPQLLLRERPAPELRRAIRLWTHPGPDPRTEPRTKGPDLEALLRLRTAAQAAGTEEAVILEPDGAVADGSTTCLVWWLGDALAIPDPDIPRVDSVTLRSLAGLATALGVEVLPDRRGPEELDGLEVWALNALHGPRIVTGWVDGPATAEQPGRLEAWRRRLSALRKPLPLG